MNLDALLQNSELREQYARSDIGLRLHGPPNHSTRTQHPRSGRILPYLLLAGLAVTISGCSPRTPAIAATNNNGGIETLIEGTATPQAGEQEQPTQEPNSTTTPEIGTPTPEPTIYVPPTATATLTDIPNPFQNKSIKASISETGQIIDIVQYYDQIIGRSIIGKGEEGGPVERGIPIVIIQDPQAFKSKAKSFKLEVDPAQGQYAFGVWHKADGKVTDYAIYLLSGRPLFEAVVIMCDESGKAYNAISNPNIDTLRFEASFAFQRACFEALRPWFDIHKLARTQQNQKYLSDVLDDLLQKYFSRRNVFDEALLADLIAAQDLGHSDAVQSRPNGRLTIGEYLERNAYIQSMPSSYFRSQFPRLGQTELELLKELNMSRILVAGARYDPEIVQFMLGDRATYAP